MPKIVVFDTETTGLPVKAPELDIAQPWPIQLGVVVFEDFQMTETLNTLACPPEGAVWSPHAIRTHGLSEELIRREGKPMADVLRSFYQMTVDADIIAAYNLPFDDRIISTTARRLGINHRCAPKALRVCIMKQFEDRYNHRPRLTSAYTQCFKQPMQAAHDAFADALAASEIMMHILSNPA